MLEARGGTNILRKKEWLPYGSQAIDRQRFSSGSDMANELPSHTIILRRVKVDVGGRQVGRNAATG